MIKNIVFDIGNVLATFKPKVFLHEVLQDPILEEKVYERVFSDSDLWNLYDQGIYEAKDVIEIASKNAPEIKKEIELVLTNWVQYVLPISSSMDVIKKYKDRYSLFILSNIPRDNYEYIYSHYDYMHEVKGGIYSYQYKMIKPDTRLFQVLLQKYELHAEECLFIDDKLENVESAKSLGFHTIHLMDHTQLPKILEGYLNEM